MLERSPYTSRFRIVAIVVVVAVSAALFFARRISSPQSSSEQHGHHEHSESRQTLDVAKSRLVRPKLPANDFVGSAACTECHPKIAEAYRTRPMANSLADVSTASVIEDYSKQVSFTPDGHHYYSVEKTPLGVYHHESLKDDQGQTLYDQRVKIDYVVGSGAQGRSYLIDRGGILFMSPISWYSTAHRWDLSPGYKLPFHRRFNRRIKDGCLLCHAGRLNAKRGVDNRFGTPPFLEFSVGCERCHGPGGRHIKYQLAENANGRDPIVNPKRLDAARRDDVCTQCHLQGEGRIPRYGCEVGDFRPGHRLEETCVLFVKGTRVASDGATRAVSQVEQMRSSACYRNSGGRLGCISCHEVHSPESQSGSLETYRAKCLNCHQNHGCSLPKAERLRQQPNDLCMNCHMPRLGGSDVPHTAHTDHRILRKPTSLHKTNGRPNTLPQIFNQAASRLSQLTVARARGLWLAEQAERRTNRDFAIHAVRLLGDVSQHLPADADVLDALGTASAVSGRFENSLTYWKRTLAIEPARESTLRTMALLLQNTGRPDAALPYLRKYLQLQPWDASMWGRYSFILGQSGKWHAAIKAAQKSETLDPSKPRVYQWLSESYKQVGNQKQHQHYADLFERITRQAARERHP